MLVLALCVVALVFSRVVVEGVKLEDSGNYTCEVRGHKSRLLASVTYLLFTIGESRTGCGLWRPADFTVRHAMQHIHVQCTETGNETKRRSSTNNHYNMVV